MTYEQLLALRADFSEMTNTQAEKAGRDLYRALYLDGNTDYGARTAHDGRQVVFYRTGNSGFDHGFFTSSDLKGHPDRKDVLHLGRLERMPWIGPIIRGEVETVEYRKEDFWRAGKLYSKRLYLLRQEGYVVWLEPHMPAGFKFATAFTPTKAKVAEYCHKTLLLRVF